MMNIYLQILVLLYFLLLGSYPNNCHSSTFSIKETRVDEVQNAFNQNQLNARQPVEFYLGEIQQLNPLLKGVIEVNPAALQEADNADYQRKAYGQQGGLHGIPILIKDNIATKDKLNTTAGSLALLASLVPQDAGVVAKLRNAGAIILGKASKSEWADFRLFSAPNAWSARGGQGKQKVSFCLNEWAGFRSLSAPDGWSARGGQGKNPYVLSADPCGSSSGSAISVAANMVAVSLGTETDGSILCPSSFNAAVGIKPTVGLTSRAGVISITPRQDTIA